MILTVTLNAAIDKRYRMKELRKGEVNRVMECSYSAGGKGLNVARIAAITGEKVMATGFAGGYTGRLLEELAGNDGILTDFVHTCGESRICLNIMEEATGEQTEILENGMEISQGEIQQMDAKYQKLLKKAEVVVISGSLPKGIGADFYVKMIEEAKKAAIPVLVDTSGETLRECVKAVPWMIKPNQDEIQQLEGKEELEGEKLVEAVARLRERGISYVVASLGKEGAVMAAASGIYQAGAPKVRAVNPVGCGDAMMAGFAIGIKNRWKEEKTLRFASALAAANAKQERTGYYVKKDFEELYQEIQVEKYKK